MIVFGVSIPLVPSPWGWFSAPHFAIATIGGGLFAVFALLEGVEAVRSNRADTEGDLRTAEEARVQGLLKFLICVAFLLAGSYTLAILLIIAIVRRESRCPVHDDA